MRRGRPISVIGIPKTIDNDISFVQKTFGFETAVAEAHRAIYAAHTEATGARNGIGLVKLMGRDSGFIAAYASLIDSQVNFCLVPEVPFTLDGFLGCAAGAAGAARPRRGGGGRRGRTGAAGGDGGAGCVGQRQTRRYRHLSAGRHQGPFREGGMEATLKYIDPSYIIRSLPANAHDSAFCLLLGQNAVHAGMAGRTNMVVGLWNHQFTHVPIALATSSAQEARPGRLAVEQRAGLDRPAAVSTPLEMTCPNKNSINSQSVRAESMSVRAVQCQFERSRELLAGNRSHILTSLFISLHSARDDMPQ